MPCSLETLQSESCDSGIGRLTNPVQLLQIIAQLLCDISTGGGVGGTIQVLIYESDPNTESLVPDDPTKPAMAYSENVALPNYNWSVINQEWQ